MFRAFDVKFVMRVHDELQLHFDETVVPDFLEASTVPWKSVERLYDALAIVADAKNTKRGVIANAVIVFPETVPDKEIPQEIIKLVGKVEFHYRKLYLENQHKTQSERRAMFVKLIVETRGIL